MVSFMRQVLALNHIVEAREKTLQMAVAGLEYENHVFERKIAAAAELAKQ